MLRQQMINAARRHAEAEIELHKTNIEVYMQSVVGIGEHSDIIETIQKELDAMATAHDRLEMLEKHFAVDTSIPV
jgi:transposase